MFAQCMENRAQSASRYLALKKQLHQDFTDNQVDVYTLNANDLTKIWIADHLDRGLSELQISAKFEELLGEQALEFTQNGFQIVDAHGATAISIVMDSKVMIALGSDMKRSGNLLGAFRTSVHNGKQYIIFKGNHRLRKTIRGTRYRINNPTIVKLGIGTEGLKAAAKGGVYVALVVSAGVNTLAWVFDESFGWREFLANVAEDLVKVALAAVVAYLGAKAVLAMSGLVVVSKIAGIVIGLIAGFGLGHLTRSDMEQFADELVATYQKSAVALANPNVLLRYGIRRAEDVLVCGVTAGGTVVINQMEGAAKARLSGLIRRISPGRLR